MTNRISKVLTIFSLLVVLALMSFVSAQSQEIEFTDSVVAFVTIDPLSDENSSLAVALGTDEPDGSFIGAIGVRCTGESSWDIQAYFDYEYFGSDEETRVEWRFDTNETQSGRWNLSTTNDAVFVPRSLQEEFLNQLVTSNRLIIGVYDFNNIRTLMYVELAELDEAVEAIGCVNTQ